METRRLMTDDGEETTGAVYTLWTNTRHLNKNKIRYSVRDYWKCWKMLNLSVKDRNSSICLFIWKH